MTNLKSRKPWLAVLLNFVAPGLGQVYNGQLFKGCVIVIAGLAWLYSIIFFRLFGTFTLFAPTMGVLLVLWLFMMIDAWRTAKKSTDFAPRKYNRWFYYIVFAIPYCLLQPDVKPYFQAFKISSGSSIPTLRIGDHVMVDKTYYLNSEVSRGDTVVFFQPDNPDTPEYESAISIVKRVIAVGGDTIEVNGANVVLNGKSLSEPYSRWSDGGAPRGNFPRSTIPPGNVFVLGDNRDHSKDSRFYNPPYIPVDDIIGKVAYIYWSFDSVDRIGMSVK